MMFRYALLLALVAGSAPALAQSGGPKAPPGDRKAGFDLYLRYGCYQCHGTVGQGAASRFGPKIAPGPLPYPLYAHQLRRPRNAMPLYTDKVLSDQQLADIYAYLASVPPAKKAADIPLLNLR